MTNWTTEERNYCILLTLQKKKLSKHYNNIFENPIQDFNGKKRIPSFCFNKKPRNIVTTKISNAHFKGNQFTCIKLRSAEERFYVKKTISIVVKTDL